MKKLIPIFALMVALILILALTSDAEAGKLDAPVFWVLTSQFAMLSVHYGILHWRDWGKNAWMSYTERRRRKRDAVKQNKAGKKAQKKQAKIAETILEAKEVRAEKICAFELHSVHGGGGQAQGVITAFEITASKATVHRRLNAEAVKTSRLILGPIRGEEVSLRIIFEEGEPTLVLCGPSIETTEICKIKQYNDPTP